MIDTILIVRKLPSKVLRHCAFIPTVIIVFCRSFHFFLKTRCHTKCILHVQTINIIRHLCHAMPLGSRTYLIDMPYLMRRSPEGYADQFVNITNFLHRTDTISRTIIGRIHISLIHYMAILPIFKLFVCIFIQSHKLMFQCHNTVEYFYQRLTIRCILPEALHRKSKVGILTQYIKILVSGFIQQCPPL